MHDIYNNLEDEVARYIEDFDTMNHNTIGFVGVAGGKILGCDMFLNPATYHKFERKLLRSYALDAIEHRKSVPAGIGAAKFFEDIKNTLYKKKLSDTLRHFSLKEDR